MYIHIDYSSGIPIIRQAVEQIKWLVVSGNLLPGNKLPSIREISRQLQINPTTVVRIYKELEHQGIIILRQGQGAFVAEQAKKHSKQEAVEAIRQSVRAALVDGVLLGLEKEDLDALVSDEYEQIKVDKHEPDSDSN